MEPKERIHALVLEKDPAITDQIKKTLKRRKYSVTPSPKKEEVLNLLKERPYQIALVGDSEEECSIFESLREIVMASPITTVILITDLSKEEVHEKAEGYGILGHLDRTVPSKDLRRLLNSFEQISKSFSPAKA